MPGPLRIEIENCESEQVQALLAFHLAAIRGSSPPEQSFALDIDALRADNITVFSAWQNERRSLETGAGPHFEAAPGMYRKRGFCAGPAFGEYSASEFNQFFHLSLVPPVA